MAQTGIHLEKTYIVESTLYLARPNHPDYVPSVFVFKDKISKAQKKRKVEKYERTTKRRKLYVDKSKKKAEDSSENIYTPTGGAGTQQDVTTAALEAFEEEATTANIMTATAKSNCALLTDTPCATNISPAPEKQEAPSKDELLEQYNQEILNLQKERDTALPKVKQLQSQIISVKTLNKNPEKIKYYTGLNYETFQVLLSFLAERIPHKHSKILSFEDQLLLTLCKLQLNIQFENLSDQFRCATTTVKDIFKRWIDSMCVKLKLYLRQIFQTLTNCFAVCCSLVNHRNIILLCVNLGGGIVYSEKQK